jgi:multiple sugar transport system substrate-binding protein
MRTPRSKRGTSIPAVTLFQLVALLILAGCGDSTDAPAKSVPNFAGITLKVGAIGDPAMLAGAKLQRGEWAASRGGTFEFGDKPIGIPEVSGVDVFLFPGEMMGDLIDAGALAVIPRSAYMVPRPIDAADPAAPDRDAEGETPKQPTGPVEAFQFNDIAPVFRDQVARYGDEMVALPYGGSALVLVYRLDAFRREANQTAAKDAGFRLEPPKTWKEFEALARFFQGRDWDGDGTPDLGVSLALGEDSEGVADSIFLARAASPGQHPDHFSFLFDADSMTPRLNSPPFVEALAGLVGLRACGPPGMDKFDARAAREAFRAGHSAMLIDRAERAAMWSQSKPIGVAPLPGSSRVFDPARKAWKDISPPNAPSYLPRGGGWLVGVRRGLQGTRLDAAIDFARFLADPENSNRVRSERSFAMLPTRISQMGQGMPDPTSAPDVDVRLWSDAVSRTLMAAKVVPGLRIPEAGGYLADLTLGRLAAMSGTPVEEALDEVVARWNKRTAALGVKHQTWHYRRSLNSLATVPDAPPKGQ